jgi:hypothetical protein
MMNLYVHGLLPFREILGTGNPNKPNVHPKEFVFRGMDLEVAHARDRCF